MELMKNNQRMKSNLQKRNIFVSLGPKENKEKNIKPKLFQGKDKKHRKEKKTK
jgi:hypothetical protein